MINIAIVDDHPLFLEALRQIVQHSLSQARVVGVFRSTQELEAAQLAPDAVLLDLNLNGQSSLHQLLEILYRDPSCEAVVVSGTANDDFARRAVLLGAKAFVHKSLPLEQMREAITHALTVAAGHGASPATDEDQRLHGPCLTFARLSPARRRVAAGVILGLQNKCIAHDLGISHGTVRNQVTEILDAFGLRRRTELVSMMQTRLVLPAGLPDAEVADEGADTREFVFDF